MTDTAIEAEKILSKDEFRQKLLDRLVGSDGPTVS
jgi:hypothetical protein